MRLGLHFSEVESELSALGDRLAAMGFRYRKQAIFSICGIYAYSEPKLFNEGASQFHVIDKGVFLYRISPVWEARVTQVGGIHWVCAALTIAELQARALEALNASQHPPGRDWNCVPRLPQ